MNGNDITLEFSHLAADRLAVYLLQGTDMSVFVKNEQKSIILKGYQTINRSGRVLRFNADVVIDDKKYIAVPVEITLEDGPNPIFATGKVTYRPRS